MPQEESFRIKERLGHNMSSNYHSCQLSCVVVFKVISTVASIDIEFVVLGSS